MAMSSKHYIMTAAILEGVRRASSAGIYTTPEHAIDAIEHDLMVMFAKDNSAFSRQRFLSASNSGSVNA